MDAWADAARRWLDARRRVAETLAALGATPQAHAHEIATEELEAARAALVEQGAGKGAGVEVRVTTRRGQVDWRSAAMAAYDPALHGGSVDEWADQYRRDGSQSVSVREAK